MAVVFSRPLSVCGMGVGGIGGGGMEEGWKGERKLEDSIDASDMGSSTDADPGRPYGRGPQIRRYE